MRQDLADFYGSITVADAAVGQLLDTLAETGLDRTTWVVFLTDHGPALPRAKSTLYDAGTGIATDRAAAAATVPSAPRVYDDLFSGVDLVPTLLGLLGLPTCPPTSRACRTPRSLRTRTDRRRCAPRSTRRRPITIPSIRSARSGPRNTATSRTTRRARCSICRWTSPTARRARRSRRCARGRRPERELYDLLDDPTESRNLLDPDATDEAEAIANDLALLLNDWRQKTNDVIPSEFAGTRISARYTETYLACPGPRTAQPIAAIAAPNARQ